MKTIKWVFFLSVSFIIAWIISITFNQPAFHQSAPIVIFHWRTPSISISYYLLGALFAGIVLGVVLMFSYMIRIAFNVRKKNKQIKLLVEEITALKNTPGGQNANSQLSDIKMQE